MIIIRIIIITTIIITIIVSRGIIKIIKIF